MPGSVIHVYHESADYLAERVRRAAPDRVVVPLATRDALRARLPEIEYLFAPMPPRDGWTTAARLRLVQLLGAGVDQLLPSPDLPDHVEVAGARGEFAADVAEHALALMLAHARDLAGFAELQRARRFSPAPRPTLAGERVTIVGHGEVGCRLARATAALAMRVRAVSRTGRGDPEPGVELVPVTRLAEAVRDARYIVIAIPLTPATRHLFDRALLDEVAAGAFLVNVARGGIVDEGALADALAAGRLAGAALDVFVDEPLQPDHPLWTAPRLVITPHVAGLGQRYVERCVAILLANVTAFESGTPRRGLIDRDAGY